MASWHSMRRGAIQNVKNGDFMGSIKVYRVLGPLIIALGITQLCHAGREPEPWDTLPQVETIRFSNDAVGFVTADHRYFIINRQSKLFRNLNQSTFFGFFPEAGEGTPSEILNDTGIGSLVLLRASNGTEYKTKNAYCSEGEDEHHGLFHKGKSVTDNIEPCHSISALEIVGDQLLLGTRLDGEYGDYPAEGIVIQSLKSAKRVRKLDASAGLTGNLIRVIRKDPHNKTIWIATEQGLNTIDQNFRIIDSQYFHEDFDIQTGKSTVFLISSPRQSNPLAVIQRQLAVDKPKEFYDAVKEIPDDKLKKFSFYNFHSGIYSEINSHSVERSFIFNEMNILIPFFIQSSQSPDNSARQSALGMLCMFNDERVIGFFMDLERNASSDSTGQWAARDCLDKYGKLGLLKENESSQRIAILLNRERIALATIKSARPDDLGPYDAGRTVIHSARSLKKMGNMDGMQLINEYFLASDGSRRDGGLYDTVVQHLYYDDEILPAVLAGLKRLRTDDFYRGCGYLIRHARYDAAYAEAVLIGLEHATRNYTKNTCEEAFRFQMQDAVVKEEFMRQFYPAFTPSQKAIADVLLR
jgi:hypothetical protein